MSKSSKFMTIVGLVLCSSLLLAQGSLNNGNTKVTYGIALSCSNSPAAGTVATCSLAADAAARYQVQCVSFSASSHAAPAATALMVNLRDGAAGAGTIIWQQTIEVTAAAAQNTQPSSVCGNLAAPGTVNTAMTLEWSAGLANTRQAVTVSAVKLR